MIVDLRDLVCYPFPSNDPDFNRCYYCGGREFELVEWDEYPITETVYDDSEPIEYSCYECLQCGRSHW